MRKSEKGLSDENPSSLAATPRQAEICEFGNGKAEVGDLKSEVGIRESERLSMEYGT
jgi:hypothetical protein